MKKKVKTILLLFSVLVVMVYFFKRPERSEQKSLNLLSVSSVQETVGRDVKLIEGPYGEKYQQELLAQLEGREKLPRFEDFPATEFSNNKNITVDINSDPVGRMFRSAIRHSVKIDGINFAGKYSIVEWGCGSTCQSGAIVDADTGHVYPLPGIMASGFEARKDSNLLIQNPLSMQGNWREWYRMLYWEWKGNRYKLVGVYKVDFAKKEIMETKEDYTYYSNWVK